MEEWKKELFETVRILKDNGVNVKEIPLTKNRKFVTLQDVIEESELHRVLEENGVEITFPIGKYISRYRKRYSGSVKGKLTEEENKIAEELGIVEWKKSGRQPSIFGRELTQFHLDIVENWINEIISGKMTNKEMMLLINKQAKNAR